MGLWGQWGQQDRGTQSPCRGSSRAAAQRWGRATCPRQEKDIRTPTPGSAPYSERVGVPGRHLQTQNGDSLLPFLGLLLGLLHASVYPSVGKGPVLMSLLWDAWQLWSPASLCQGDSLSLEPLAPASSQKGLRKEERK